MNREQWGTVMRYFQACWVKFSVEDLALELSRDITFTGRDKVLVGGKQEVLDLFQEKFFTAVNIFDTVIHNFEVKSWHGFGIVVNYKFQQGPLMHISKMQEIFTFDDNNLIDSIERN